VVPLQMPAVQTSVWVQAMPSLQPVPLGLLPTMQPPLPSQVDEEWHWPAVQLYVVPTHAPLLQTSVWVQAVPSLQPVVSGLLPPSTQVCAPVMHEVTPSRHWFGLVVQAAPAVQATQLPALLQTMLVPQLEPAARCALLLHTIVPVVQLVMPV
jgi:hypothetical protein